MSVVTVVPPSVVPSWKNCMQHSSLRGNVAGRITQANGTSVVSSDWYLSRNGVLGACKNIAPMSLPLESGMLGASQNFAASRHTRSCSPTSSAPWRIQPIEEFQKLTGTLLQQVASQSTGIMRRDTSIEKLDFKADMHVQHLSPKLGSGKVVTHGVEAISIQNGKAAPYACGGVVRTSLSGGGSVTVAAIGSSSLAGRRSPSQIEASRISQASALGHIAGNSVFTAPETSVLLKRQGTSGASATHGTLGSQASTLVKQGVRRSINQILNERRTDLSDNSFQISSCSGSAAVPSDTHSRPTLATPAHYNFGSVSLQLQANAISRANHSVQQTTPTVIRPGSNVVLPQKAPLARYQGHGQDMPCSFSFGTGQHGTSPIATLPHRVQQGSSAPQVVAPILSARAPAAAQGTSAEGNLDQLVETAGILLSPAALRKHAPAQQSTSEALTTRCANREMRSDSPPRVAGGQPSPAHSSRTASPKPEASLDLTPPPPPKR